MTGDPLTQEQQRTMETMGAAIFFPQEFKDWMVNMVAVQIPLIPFSQILGAKLNLARSADAIATSEAVTGSVYVDAATPGPLLTNIANGKYIIFYGAHVPNGGKASPSINGSTPSDDNAITSISTGGAGARGKLVTLTSNNLNSVKLQYKAGGNFRNRWLVAWRIGAA